MTNIATFIIICILVGLKTLFADVISVPEGVFNATNNESLIINNTADNDTLKIENKTFHFVNNIKTNLLKNNDDYKELHAAKVSPEGDTRRRLKESEDSLSLSVPNISGDKDGAVFRSLALDPIPKANAGLHKLVGFGEPDGKKEKGDKHKSPINYKDHKRHMDTWQRLIDKNKRLRKYTSTTKVEPSSPATFASVAMKRTRSHSTKRHHRVKAERTHSHTHHTHSHTSKGLGRFKELLIKHTEAVRARPLHVMLPLRSPGPGRAPPNADQLDMAPARGAYIHDLRVKGLFCHRNVLWPEGPKYDSKGNTIMPPFDPKLYGHGNKNFADTTKPPFVLPRCCNCCKKSVLGCQ